MKECVNEYKSKGKSIKENAASQKTEAFSEIYDDKDDEDCA